MGLAALALAPVVLLAGCGSDGGAGSTPVAPSGDGAALFGRFCASCHGENLRGTDRGPSLLSIVYEPAHHGDEAFRRAIALGSPSHHWGFGDMPAIDGVEPGQVEAIIAHVRAVQQREGFDR